MKKTDTARQFIAVFHGLQQRRSQLQSEIDEIDQALGQIRNVAPTKHDISNGTRMRTGRGGNAMPLREAVVRVLSSGPKTKDELMAAVRQIGYRFTGADPMNSLQTFLYGAGKRMLKRVEGKKFALSGGAKPTAQSAGTKGKRKMSAEGRKRIAEAARARWAKVRAGKTAATKPAKAKRTMSAAGRAKISAAAKARWAKEKGRQS